MNEPRHSHTATLLPNGKVLVTGGQDDSFGIRGTAEIYDPDNNTWTSTAPMSVRRREHTATLLQNGKVLISGGTPQGTDAQASVDLYDYSTNSWSVVAPMQVARFRHTSTLLPSGKVLIVGGNNSRNESYKSVEIYDSTTDTWALGSPLKMARFGHSATLLPTGQVLILGGIDTTQEFDSSLYYAPFSSELFDPIQGVWTLVAAPSATREQHATVLLADGTILEAGGLAGASNSFVHTRDTLIYNPNFDSWISAGLMDRERVRCTATRLNDGSVLVAGGFDFSFGTNATTQLFKALNSPPLSSAGSDVTIEATSPAGSQVTLNGSASSDPDGDSLTYTWYENGSIINGPTNDPISQVSLGLGRHTIQLDVNDGKGGNASDFVVINVEDTTPPIINCAAADTFWHAADTNIACAATDSGTGLANSSDSTFQLGTSVPVTTEVASAATNSRSICDLLGNCVTAGPITGNMIDKKPPDITINLPINTSYHLNQIVLTSYLCVDGGSGVASCTAAVLNGSPLDTASAGTKTFTVTAVDNVGNINTKSLTYIVSYNICLRYDPNRSVRNGRALPLRISLCDVNSNNLSSPLIYVTGQGVTMISTNSTETLQDVGNANPDNNFRYDSTLGGYVFNLSTQGYSVGTYALSFTISSDPTTHNLLFQIK